MNSKLYVGQMVNCKREIVRSDFTPTVETHGKRYLYVIGPFRTKRGAVFTRDYGRGNPHCQCVADAEHLAKFHVSKWDKTKLGFTW